jgi:type IV pilus assembly protein PilB
MVLPDKQLQDLILQSGLIPKDKLDNLSLIARNSGLSLVEVLLEKEAISDENLGIIIANYYHVPFINLSKVTVPEELLKIVPEKSARKQKIVPFAKDENGLKIAMIDPSNQDAISAISKKINTKVIPHFATDKDIEGVLRQYTKDLQKTLEELVREEGASIEAERVSADVPTEKIVYALLEFAYHDRASDIHIEPEEKETVIRFRMDGILHEVLKLPKNIHDRIITRIKILSRLRTDEHLAPQDGKMRVKIDEEEVDIRVSIIPIADGEKVALRLLTSHFRHFTLTDLGMNSSDLKKVTSAYNKSFGMVLSTGPTGSGKTTSIYAILKILNVRERNITTIEDPVEYKIKGVNQIQVNTKTDLTFANGLRTILRQDPNVVFVGEIRDSETAGIAVNAALTGHLVLSTLHTNDAATTLPRLIDMQVEPFLVASTVNVIIAQRLVRKICDICRISYDITRSEFDKNFPDETVTKHFQTQQQIKIYKGKGCKRCHGTGYQGRLGIFEVLQVSNAIRELIAEKNDSDIIERKAIEEGMSTMLDDGLEKVARGVTTVEEVLRVTKTERA